MEFAGFNLDFVKFKRSFSPFNIDQDTLPCLKYLTFLSNE